MIRPLAALGPAIIVAAVVLGPGSILTSSKVGASFGWIGLPVVALATVLMIGMVALAARLGAVLERSPCAELAHRLGRPVAIAIGGVLFLIVALFQSSNNLAVIGGLEPLLGERPVSGTTRAAILIALNAVVIIALYRLRDLYRSVERLMKTLVGLIALAFLINFVLVLVAPAPAAAEADPGPPDDWIPLLGLVGTTFSVAGAFYQAYLVREKGWGLGELRRGLTDSLLGISVLGLITCMILFTGWKTFHGRPGAELASVADVALQLEPLFGPAATVIFGGGILAAALSSFLGNALIGGTVFSDALGTGARLDRRGPLHLTSLALLAGMAIALVSLAREGDTVALIALAQALTVLGIPALALALLYLGTRPDLRGDRRVPRALLLLATIGLLVSCTLAALTAAKLIDKLAPDQAAHAAGTSLPAGLPAGLAA